MTDVAGFLLLYSEWLDGQGLMKPDDGDKTRSERTHEDLVNEFLARKEKGSE